MSVNAAALPPGGVIISCSPFNVDGDRRAGLLVAVAADV